jgi:hypothetical protein
MIRYLPSWFQRGAFCIVTLLIVFPLLAEHAAGQATPPTPVVSDTTLQVRLTTGDLYVGEVVAVDGDRVTLRTATGVQVQFERAQIASIQPARGRFVDGAFWMEDPNVTRLMFAPTGRTLPSGDGYAGVFELFFPFVSFGITDWFTISGGTPVVPEAIGRVLYLAPKARIFSGGGFDLSTGVLALFDLTATADDGSLGIVYGVGTYGTRDNAVSGGVGWGFVGDDVASRPLFMLGGELRISRRIKLVSENYLISYRDEVYDFVPPADPNVPTYPEFTHRRITRNAGLGSAGVRIIGERLSADAGLGVFVGEGEAFCCLPLVNFVYNFGAGR